MKTKINRLRRALSERGEEAGQVAEQAAVNAVSALDRAAAKGVLHPNNAARRKSRLMKRLAAAVVGAPAGPATAPQPGSRRGASSRKATSK